MLKTAATLVAISCLVVVGYFFFFNPVSGQEVEPSSIETSVECVAELPDVAYMGEGSGEYTLPVGYDVFVVKRHNGHFYVENGPTYNSPGPKDEWIYACFGICDKFSKLQKSHIRLGERQTGEVVNIMVLDHKTTGKPHWWSHNPNPMDPYLRIDTAERVELFSLTIPFNEKWWFHSEDDVGVLLECGNPFHPTDTPESTPTEDDDDDECDDDDSSPNGGGDDCECRDNNRVPNSGNHDCDCHDNDDRQTTGGGNDCPTYTPIPTETPTQEITEEWTETPEDTETPTPEETIIEDPPTAIPTDIASATWMPPTETPTMLPTFTPTMLPTFTPTMLPTFTPVATPTDDGGGRDLYHVYIPYVECPKVDGLPMWCRTSLDGIPAVYVNQD